MIFWISSMVIFSLCILFLWHPSLREELSNTSKVKIICTILCTSCMLYFAVGSPHIPDHPLAHIRKSSTRSLNNKIREIRNNPSNAKKWVQLAEIYAKQGQFYKSALHYREAWRLDPKNSELKRKYANLLKLLKQHTY